MSQINAGRLEPVTVSRETDNMIGSKSRHAYSTRKTLNEAGYHFLRRFSIDDDKRCVQLYLLELCEYVKYDVDFVQVVAAFCVNDNFIRYG